MQTYDNPYQSEPLRHPASEGNLGEQSTQQHPMARADSRVDVPNDRCPTRGASYVTAGMVPAPYINARSRESSSLPTGMMGRLRLIPGRIGSVDDAVAAVDTVDRCDVFLF